MTPVFFDITYPWVTRTDQNEGLNTLVKTKRGKKLQAVLRCFHPTVWHTQTLPFLSAPGYGSPWSAVCELEGHPNRSCCRWRLDLSVVFCKFLEGLLRLEDIGGWIEMVHYQFWTHACQLATTNNARYLKQKSCIQVLDGKCFLFKQKAMWMLFCGLISLLVSQCCFS